MAQCILDNAKYFMLKFFYEVLKPAFGDDITLCMTDTDSFLFELRKHDFYEYMAAHKEYFDTSGYPKDNPAYSGANKKVSGKMKEEYNFTPILKYTGLRAKMYVVVTKDNSEKKKAKGIKKCVVQNEITANDYEDCLFTNKEYSHCQHTITSKKHVLYTVKTKKKSLSTFDNKRVVLRDGISTVPYGYYALRDHKLALSEVHEEMKATDFQSALKPARARVTSRKREVPPAHPAEDITLVKKRKIEPLPSQKRNAPSEWSRYFPTLENMLLRVNAAKAAKIEVSPNRSPPE